MSGSAIAGRTRPALMLVLALLLAALAWEVYKAVGSDDGGSLFGVRLLPRADDVSMPHLWEIAQRLADP